MDILRMIRSLFEKKQKTYVELDDKYVIVTNTLSYPVLCLKTSIIVSETEKALYRFDTAAPEGKGRVFSFTEGMKKWATQGGKYSICPMSTNATETESLKQDKEAIIAYAKELKVSDLVINSLESGCDGYPKPTKSTVYDQQGNRIESSGIKFK